MSNSDQPKDTNLQQTSSFEDLDRWANETVAALGGTLGYPGNQVIQLREFYDWYVSKELQCVCTNNVGDPFTQNPSPFSTHRYEREVIEYFAPYYGFRPDNVWGIVTNSGTDGNNHGIYFGVNYLRRKTGKEPVLYVSDEAHYSNRRLAHLQNLDLRLIKSDPMGRMVPEELDKALDPSRPCLIVYAMGSTFKGAIDDQKALNAILDRHPGMEVYHHVDAALFGGYLPFSRFCDVLNRNNTPFESISVSGHKFFGMDEPAGFFLTTKEIYHNQTQFDIAYLNEDMKMIACSRSAVTPLKFWWLIRNVGAARWHEQAEQMLECTAYLKRRLDEIGYPSWVNELSNTVFFKRPKEELVARYSLADNYDERFGGAISHVVVMQHVTHAQIDRFVNDLG